MTQTITLTPESRADWPDWAHTAWELEPHRHGSITPISATEYAVKVMTTGEIIHIQRGATLTLAQMMGA